MTDQQTISAVVGRFYAALRANDVEAWLGTFAEDAIAHDPVGTPPHHGHGGLRAFLAGVLEQFETFGLTEEDVFHAPAGAAVKWTGRGRAKNGRCVEFEGIDVFVLDPDGRIRSLHAYWNAAPFLAAIALPATG